MYMCIGIHIHVCMYIHTFVCTYTPTHAVYTCMNAYICSYILTHVHNNNTDMCIHIQEYGVL